MTSAIRRDFRIDTALAEQLSVSLTNELTQGHHRKWEARRRTQLGRQTGEREKMSHQRTRQEMTKAKKLRYEYEGFLDAMLPGNVWNARDEADEAE